MLADGTPIPWRWCINRGLEAIRYRVPRSARWFFPIGASFGFLEGVIGGAGSLMAPFFLAFGLMKGTYIGTDALATGG